MTTTVQHTALTPTLTAAKARSHMPCEHMTEQSHRLCTENEPVYSFTRGSYMEINEDNIASTLMARDYKDPQAVCRKDEE